MFRLQIPLSLLLLAASIGCGQNNENNDPTPDAGTNNTAPDMGGTAEDGGTSDAGDGGMVDTRPSEPPYDDCTITVGPSEEPADNFAAIQNALFDVEEGGVVCLHDGTYDLEEELSLEVANVEVRGESREGTILDFLNQEQGANGISATSDGLTFSTFTVRNTPGDAIRVTGADGLTFRNLIVTWSGGPNSDNGAYGLYPVQCQNVLIEENIVSNASDAGIYVGQSSNVIVRNNEAFGNVAGIEIENTTGAEVHDNHAHDNTGGVLIFDLPGPPVQGGNSNKIRNNLIENNNEPNFAEPGNIVGLVPSGTGIFVLASDRNELHDNVIRGNRSMGVAVISFQTTGQPYDFNPDFDPFAEGNWVHDNEVYDNGGDPKGFVTLVVEDTLEQLVWDGIIDPDKDNADGSLTNCFSNNVDDMGAPASYRMIDGPGFSDQSTALADNDCEHTPLPTVTLE